MKNIKVLLLATMTMLFLGVGNSYTQETTIVSGFVYSPTNIEFSISVVDSKYEKKEVKYYKSDGKDFLITLKQELDGWLSKGYEIIDSNSASTTTTSNYRVTYILIKKQ